MFTEKMRPAHLSRTKLDEYLANGWYRMGQAIFTCHFLCFGERIYSAVWLRLNLEQHQFSKSQRKLVAKGQQFRMEISNIKLDKQKEILYHKYRWYRFKGNISTSLKESLLDGGKKNIFHTMECCIYDGQKLIAASFFDVGDNSIASILGMYDPDYAKFSLGYLTMLYEIQYGIENSFQYYYPGYIVPGYTRFDYKLNIGKVDYYNVSKKQWLPHQILSKTEMPLEKTVHQLKMLREALLNNGIQNQLFYYPLFETHLITYWDDDYLKYPAFLWCSTLDGSSDYLLVVYDLVKENFLLLDCTLFSDLPSFLEELFEEANMDQPCFLEVLTVKNMIAFSNDVSQFVQVLKVSNRLRRIK